MAHQQGGNGRGFDPGNGFAFGQQQHGGYRNGGQGQAQFNGGLSNPGVSLSQSGSVNYNLYFTSPGNYNLNFDGLHPGRMGLNPAGGSGVDINRFGCFSGGTGGMSDSAVVAQTGNGCINRQGGGGLPMMQQNSQGFQRNGGGLLTISTTSSPSDSGLRVGIVNRGNGNAVELSRGGFVQHRLQAIQNERLARFMADNSSSGNSQPTVDQARFAFVGPMDGNMSSSFSDSVFNDGSQDQYNDFDSECAISSQQSQRL